MKQKEQASRRVSRIVCCLFALVTAATATMITADAAGNIRGEDFSLSISQYQVENSTSQRDKLDATSVYMRVDSKSGGIITRVYGADSSSSSLVDCSMGHIYPANRGVTYMINNVYETGRHYAAIHAAKSSSPTAGISGVWSPDSV